MSFGLMPEKSVDNNKLIIVRNNPNYDVAFLKRMAEFIAKSNELGVRLLELVFRHSGSFHHI